MIPHLNCIFINRLVLIYFVINVTNSKFPSDSVYAAKTVFAQEHLTFFCGPCLSKRNIIILLPSVPLQY